MAGEIGHVVYGARILTHLQDAVQHPMYWVGTLFPDIRHLGIVSRHRTHPSQVTLKTLKGKNDFQTGMRVHAWIDATREQFLHKAHIKENLPWHPFVPHALKLVEDELVYAHFDDWPTVIHALGKIYDDELFYIDSKERISTWHHVLQTYLKQAPTDETRKQLSTSIGLSENSADEVNSVVRMLKNDKRVHELLKTFWHQLEDLLN